MVQKKYFKDEFQWGNNIAVSNVIIYERNIWTTVPPEKMNINAFFCLLTCQQKSKKVVLFGMENDAKITNTGQSERNKGVKKINA